MKSVIAALSIISFLLMVSLFIPQTEAISAPITEGYVLDETIFSSDFHTADANFTIDTPYSGAGFQYTTDGLLCNWSSASKLVRINIAASESNAVRMVATATISDANRPLWYFALKGANDYPNIMVIINPQPYTVAISGTVYTALGVNHAMDAMNIRMDGNGTFTYDMMVSIATDGILTVGVNGVDVTQDLGLSFVAPCQVTSVRASSGLAFDSTPHYINSVTVGSDAEYVDVLHPTITPWGYDLTYSVHFHADGARPATIAAITEISETYGLKGTLDIFMRGDATEWGWNDTGYAQAVLDLYNSGWSIGIHAFANHNVTRADMLTLLDTFEDYFGTLKTFSDHGYVQQTMIRNGMNSSNQYYIADILVDKGTTVWVNDVPVSHSIYVDLNIGGVSYENSTYEGLNLFRVTALQSGAFFNGYASKAAMEDAFQTYAWQRAVILEHEYIARFLYAMMPNGTKYTLWPTVGDYIYNSDVYFDSKHNLPEATWHALPNLVTFLSMLNDYNTWYAPAYDVWARSHIIQQMTVSDAAGTVTITNPTATDVPGFTLYSISEPEYALQCDNKIYYPVKGTYSWSFVIDEVPRGASIILSKVDIPLSAPTIYLDSSPVAYWTDGNRMGVYALTDGQIHIDPSFDYTDYRLTKSDGTVVEYTDGSLLWNATRGEIYTIQSNADYHAELMNQAISPIFAIIPLVIIMSVIPVVMGLGRKLK